MSLFHHLIKAPLESSPWAYRWLDFAVDWGKWGNGVWAERPLVGRPDRGVPVREVDPAQDGHRVVADRRQGMTMTVRPGRTGGLVRLVSAVAAVAAMALSAMTGVAEPAAAGPPGVGSSAAPW